MVKISENTNGNGLSQTIVKTHQVMLASWSLRQDKLISFGLVGCRACVSMNTDSIFL